MRTSLKSYISFITLLIILFFSNSDDIYSLENYSKLSFSEKFDGLGSQPIHIIKTSDNNFEIFCLGLDKDFNGIIEVDKGEEYSSWYRLTVVETTSIPAAISFSLVKIQSFEDDIIQFGFRPIFDTVNNKIYLNFLKKVKVLNVGNISDAKVENEDLFAIQNFGQSNVVLDLFDGKIITIKYENFKSDSIRIFENNSKLTILNSFLCGSNTLNAKFFENQILVLDQGIFGNSNSMIYEIDLPSYPDLNEYEINDNTIGDGANDIYFENIENKSLGYLVLSADNKILVTKKDGANKINFEYKIGDPKSYNGPRQIITNKNLNYFYVTTYDKKVYVFDKSFLTSDNPNLEPIDTLEVDNLSESMATYDSFNFAYTFITTPYDETYKAVNTIDVFRDKLKTSVVELEAYKNDINIYPNPVEKNSKLYVDISTFDNNQNTNFTFSNYKIYSLEGKLIVEDNIILNQNIIEINLINLNIQNGAYILELSSKDIISIVRKLIVK